MSTKRVVLLPCDGTERVELATAIEVGLRLESERTGAEDATTIRSLLGFGT